MEQARQQGQAPRRFQFGLRSLLLAVTCVAVLCGLVSSVSWLLDPPLSGATSIRGNFTLDLPPGSRHRRRRGIDSAVGELRLGGTPYVLYYDMGQWAPTCDKWRGQEEIGSVHMDYAIETASAETYLLVHFSSPEADLSPTSFSACVETPEDVEATLQVMRTLKPIREVE